MIPIDFAELRRNLATHLDRIAIDRTECVVTRPNREDLVILPLAELTSLRETLHLLSSLANATRLAESMAELEAGSGTERALIEPSMRAAPQFLDDRLTL